MMFTYEDVEEIEAVPEFDNEIEAVPEDGNLFDEEEDIGLVDAPVRDITFDDDEELSAEELQELDTEENRNRLEQVRRDITGSRDLYWDLCRNLHHVKVNKLHKLLGFKTWQQYIHTEVGFDTRTAGYYTSLYEYYGIKLRGILADRPDLYKMVVDNIKKIGWTKSEIISKKNFLKADNIEGFFNQVTALNERGRLPSVEVVKELVEKQVSSMSEVEKLDADEDNENRNEFVRLNLKFTPAQHNPVQDAMNIANEICGGGKKPSSLISWVCGEFVTNYSTDRGEPITLSKVMGRFEDSLDVDMIAVCRKTGKVLHGVEKYQEIQSED